MQFAPERCHSPSHTALSKLLYMPLLYMPLKGLHTLSWGVTVTLFDHRLGGSQAVQLSRARSHYRVNLISLP